jgi:prepilin-type N-terminal cleavage/methylation domain-containing protein
MTSEPTGPMRVKVNSLRGGFTLVELLIVMVLIGILAVVLWARFGGIYEEAYRSSMVSDLKTVASVQEMYYAINMRYGTVPDLTSYTPTDGVIITINHADNGGFAAVATHAGAPAITCGYYTGDVPAGSADPATRPNVPICTN